MMELLIIGTVPPPNGGVTIHIRRINDFLDYNQFPYKFIDYKKNSFLIILDEIRKHKIIHLHASNVFFKLIITIYCFLLRKKSILTFHGNLKQYSGWKYFFNNLALKFTRTPIVLNIDSLEIAKKLNKNTQYITAFIPPLNPVKEDNDQENIKKIKSFLSNKNAVACCTNGKYVLDQYGKDLYGIIELVELFKTLDEKFKLIISDPTKSYLEKIRQEKIEITNNILFITNEHAFIHIIKESNIVIRNTTTDGDALTIKEGLFYNKTVLATNVINRHDWVKTYSLHDMEDLKKYIEQYPNQSQIEGSFNENGAENLILLYKSLSGE